jgi:polysaccharide pyruvyl transferase WcaK-like protein
MAEPRILLIGYNGANNTGAEALLLADIADVRAVFGPRAPITVPALEPANLRRYLGDAPGVRIEHLPAIFPLAVRRLVREHDLVMLVEGSAYMDTWTSALLWYFLWATRCAAVQGTPCIAYAVDAGQLRPRNERLVRRHASRTDLIVTRSAAAAERLRSWGVTAPIEATADNAFTFRPNEQDRGWLRDAWPVPVRRRSGSQGSTCSCGLS